MQDVAFGCRLLHKEFEKGRPVRNSNHTSLPSNRIESIAVLRGGAIKAILILAASVLAIAEPVVIGSLSAITIVCAVLAAFYGFVAKSAHFPMTTVFCIGIGSALGASAYYAMMDALLRDE